MPELVVVEPSVGSERFGAEGALVRQLHAMVPLSVGYQLLLEAETMLTPEIKSRSSIKDINNPLLFFLFFFQSKIIPTLSKLFILIS